MARTVGLDVVESKGLVIGAGKTECAVPKNLNGVIGAMDATVVLED